MTKYSGMHADLSIKAGITGGVLMSLLANIRSADLLKTVILAAVGAVVSFMISWLLKWILKKHRR